MKHQSDCYRIIKGVKYINWCDLIYQPEENDRILKEIKAKKIKHRRIKHPDGYYQLFIKKI